MSVAPALRSPDVRLEELARFNGDGAFELPPLFRFTFCDACGDWHWRALREPIGVQVTANQKEWLADIEDLGERRRRLAATRRYHEPILPSPGEKPASLKRIRKKLIADARPLATNLVLIADGDAFGLTEQARFELARTGAARTNVFRRPYSHRLTDPHRGQLERGRLDLRERGWRLTDKEVARRLAGLSTDEWTRTVAVIVGCLLFQHSERFRSSELKVEHPSHPWYPEYQPRRSKPIPSNQANWDLYLLRLLSIVRNEYVDIFSPGLLQWRSEDKRSGGELAKTHTLSEFDEFSEIGNDGDDRGDGGLIELASTDDIDARIDALGPLLPSITSDVERLLWLIVHAGYTREEASVALGKSKSWGGVTLHRLRESDNPRVLELKWRLVRDQAIGVMHTTGGKTAAPRVHLGFWGIPAGSVAHTTRPLRGKLLFPNLRKTDYSQPDFWNLCNETAPKRELVGVEEERYRRGWWHRPNLHLSVAETLAKTSRAPSPESLGRPLPDGHPSNVAFAIDFRRELRLVSLSSAIP